ncbi:MAG: phosphate ABC transporter permease subunit PstC [Albidovulum sp.]|uniref:phosphate ABC transporter permease subunit PstC n=1 Tax=Albidovulum sp. TaxID=1872424 RepID=UPI001328F7FD|nr:phosphate ABC transporter permease subunit PstC [Defluviimonas sp.]KAB2885160.1 MAG: phosphate ABC transporter permease subunit PstC [Defluviimonas sp.]
MTNGILVLIVMALAAAAHVLARRRSLAVVAGDIKKLHSLPAHHGQTGFLFTAVPALLLMALWLVVQPFVIDARVGGMIADSDVPAGSTHELVMADVRRISDGLDTVVALGGSGEEEALASMRADSSAVRARLAKAGVALGDNVGDAAFTAAAAHRALVHSGRNAMTAAVLALAVAGLGFGLSRVRPDFRARIASERFVTGLLIASSLIAILTTLGIVASLLFETLHFFRLYPASDFFFSTVWNPQFRGGSDLGIWPLLWGTIYVSLIALVVAVPVGLMSAIYLSEYASARMRAWVKPAIEILAGIPTIVYGLFALITVGPILRDYFAQPFGLGSSSSSVMTAGIVMGIMVIPFVSSLSDDIINAVPQSLRDGSLALGATPSETVRQVVFPAALPGIVGAILLAASRAIGETMIVVMGAGAAAKLSLNPFEAMTTVTVKIVSQLTGDTEFASPETLVAFALGLTLFVMTLALNILALYIVRKYREQYE